MDIEERLEALEQKVQGLERAGRRWKALTAGLALLLLVGVTVAQTRPEVADVLRCRKLEVVDAQGKARAILVVAEEGSGLLLYDAQGQTLWSAP